MHRVEHEPQRLERNGAQKRGVSGFAEYHRSSPLLIAVKKDRIALLALDDGAVGEPKALT